MAKKKSNSGDFVAPQQERFLQPGAPYETNARPYNDPNFSTDRELPIPQRKRSYGEFMYEGTPAPAKKE